MKKADRIELMRQLGHGSRETKALLAIFDAVRKEIGSDTAFSDDVEVCGNCGHEYTGKRLCPECGA